MAINESLTNRIREALVHQPLVVEKTMFKCLCFMVNDKMCICVRSDGLLCRIGAQQAVIELENSNCRQMIHGGRVMKDFVFVEDTEVQMPSALAYWLTLCLKFNSQIKASKKRKSKTPSI